jgi:hypothetical protein
MYIFTLKIQKFTKYAPKYYSDNQTENEIDGAILHVWGRREMLTGF